MKDSVDYVIEQFRNCFRKNGYYEEAPVDISSGMDDSVTFIGSTISVLKPIFLENRIKEQGHFLIQPAIRTQSLKNIYNLDVVSEWSSYFDALGTLVRYGKLNKLVDDTLDFFLKYLKIPTSRLLIRINSSDIDLVQSIKPYSHQIQIEYDSKPDSYYRHKYGLSKYSIYGRNFNIAILDLTDNLYKDVGNIIIIESKDKKYGVELALGVNSIIMRKDGVKTSLEASILGDIVSFETNAHYKYAECLSVVSNLLYENIDSKGQKRYGIYLFRKYRKALFYWADYLNIDMETMILQIEKYIQNKYKLNYYDENAIRKRLGGIVDGGN